PIAALGGAERSLLDLMAAVRKADPALELHLIAGTEGPLLEAATRLGIHARLLPMPQDIVGLGDSALQNGAGLRSMSCRLLQGARIGVATCCYAGQLARTLQALRPDLIHSNGNKFHLLTWLAASK